MSPQQALALLRILDWLVLAIGASGAIRARYAQNRTVLERILAEDRDPTEAEWTELDSQIADLTARLRSAADGTE